MSRGNPSEVFLTLIEENGFNNMDGKQIAKELRAERHLWEAVLFCRETLVGITLRDMPDGSYNADTIFLLTDMIRQTRLFELVKKWGADSIIVATPTDTWAAGRYDDDYTLKSVQGESAASFLCCAEDNHVVLRLWWD